MSDPINANPNVVDASALPTRQVGGKGVVLELKRQLDFLLGLLLTRTPAVEADTPMTPPPLELDHESDEEDPVDAQEIYDLIAPILDPEHPLLLGQLLVVNLDDIQVHDAGDRLQMAEVVVRITPTITHCLLATLIGLGIRVRLDRSLPPRFRITILVKEGTHQSESQVNKQLNDKERVAAACENEQLTQVVSQMLATCK